MADRTYVFRLRGDGGDLQATTDAAGASFDKLSGKAGDFGTNAAAAGSTVAKSYAAQGAAATAAAHGIDGFSFSTSAAKRELLVLTHELSQGNFTRFTSSLLVLGERTGAASLLFSGLGAAALAATAVVTGVAIEIAKGATEQDKFNKSLVLTGNAAGQTNDSIVALTKTYAASTGATVANSRAIADALVAQGDIGPALIEPLGDAMLRVQKLTGETTQQIAQEFKDLPKEPTAAALKLNEAFNFLDSATYEHIHQLEQIGDKQGAAIAAADALSSALRDRQAPAVGTLGKLYEAFNRGLDDTLQKLQALGREPTAEAKLDSLYTKLQKLQQEADNPSFLQKLLRATGINQGSNEEELEGTKNQIGALVVQRSQAADKALKDSQDAETKRQGVAAQIALDALDARIKGTTRLQQALKDLAAQEAAEVKDRQRNDPNFQIDPKVHAARVAQLTKDNTPAGQGAGVGDGLLQAIAAQREQVALEEKQISDGGKVDVVQKFLADSANKLADSNYRISDANRARALSLLALLKTENGQLQVDKLAKIAADERVAQDKETAELTLKATDDIDKFVDAQAVAIQLVRQQNDLIGQSAQQRAEQAATDKLDAQYRTADHELALLEQKAVIDGNADAVAAIALQRKALADQAQQIRGDLIPAVDELFAKQTSGYAGVQVALQKYRDDAANSSQFAQQVISGGLQKTEDAMLQFEETGKLSFSALFKFMAEEFLKNLNKMILAQASSGFGDFFTKLGSFFGATGSVDGAGGAALQEGPYPILASGTNYVKRGGLAHIDEGEAVVPKPFNAAGWGMAANSSPLEVHVHNEAGAQIGADQDADGKLHIYVQKAMNQAIQQGAALGHARVSADLRSGTGPASTALKQQTLRRRN